MTPKERERLRALIYKVKPANTQDILLDIVQSQGDLWDFVRSLARSVADADRPRRPDRKGARTLVVDNPDGTSELMSEANLWEATLVGQLAPLLGLGRDATVSEVVEAVRHMVDDARAEEETADDEWITVGEEDWSLPDPVEPHDRHDPDARGWGEGPIRVRRTAFLAPGVTKKDVDIATLRVRRTSKGLVVGCGIVLTAADAPRVRAWLQQLESGKDVFEAWEDVFSDADFRPRPTRRASDR